jgi:hypothetical protein
MFANAESAAGGLARGSLAWIGLVVVVQNIISCLFNSHLFDFTQGWTYVFGVGIAAGALAHCQSAAEPTAALLRKEP